MATLVSNNRTLTYSTSSTANNYTINITNLSGTSSFLDLSSRKAYLKVGDTTVISVTASQTPSQKQILSSMNHGGSASTSDMIAAAETEKTKKQTNASNAWTTFTNSFTTKKNANQLTFTYVRHSTDDKYYPIVFSVFGVTSSVTITVPKKAGSGSSQPETQETNRTIGIENVNDGKNYVVNENAYAKYGHVERVVDFSEVESEQQLLELANEYVNSMQFDDMTLSVSAVDLHTLTGSVRGFELLDEVRCISVPHGLDKIFPITEITIPLDDPSGVQYTLGKSGVGSMSQTSSANAGEVFKRVKKLPSPTRILDAAKIEMSNVLEARNTGYVKIVQENEISQALVISNNVNWTEATKLWKFDINGFGYSDSTVGALGRYDNATTINADGRLYKIGMTMDGTIVADFIKVGLLEDGLGYNYWNLGTGEFSLSPNTLINGDQMLNGSVTKLEDLGLYLEASYTKEVGSKNILRKSDDFSIVNQSNKYWSDGGWTTLVSPSNVTGIYTHIIDAITNGRNGSPPAPDIQKAVLLMTDSDSTRMAAITQKNVQLSVNTTYTLACYACGIGTLTFKIIGGYGSSNTKITVKKDSTLGHNDWRRYNLVFKTVSNTTYTSTYLSSAKQQADNAETLKNQKLNDLNTAISQNATSSVLKQKRQDYETALKTYKEKLKIYNERLITVPLRTDKTIDIQFCGSKGARYGSYISGLTLVKGNVSGEWSPSESDMFDQINAFSNNLSQKYIIDKLTDGGKKEGIFLQDGHLYLNATYMYAGVLSDRTATNSWNLITGAFKTTKMVASGIRASGVLENQDTWGSRNGKPLYDRITLNSKGIKFTYQAYVKNKIYSGTYGQFSRGTTLGNLQISSSTLQLNVNDVVVTTKYITKGSIKQYAGVTGSMNIRGVIQGSGGKLQTVNLAQLTVIHGLVVGMAVYNTSSKKLVKPSSSLLTGGIFRNAGKLTPRKI